YSTGELLLTVSSLSLPLTASISLVPAAQFILISHPRKDHDSSEDLSKELLISREDLLSEEDVVIHPPGDQKSQQPELLHPIPQEDSFRNTELQLEETTERKLAKLDHEIRKNLDKTVKETMDNLKHLFPHACEVMRP
ncbi:glycosylation-dependent cell adhesion molecule 1-like, partial [Trichechus manatus latirostris]|uniref:Glycosylation-dependent cell adhesion molecule 1 n=1 Tax=Trichechus manatus latirostris TaxID=127582 RepID=A0A2Y9QRN1_TRIMA